jgi:hypothetical protein
MTNDQMKPRRFLNLYNAKTKLNWIVNNINNGLTVYVCTQIRKTGYNKKHIDMFKATKSGLYVQSGKKYLNIDFNQLIAQ